MSCTLSSLLPPPTARSPSAGWRALAGRGPAATRSPPASDGGRAVPYASHGAPCSVLCRTSLLLMMCTHIMVCTYIREMFLMMCTQIRSVFNVRPYVVRVSQGGRTSSCVDGKAAAMSSRAAALTGRLLRLSSASRSDRDTQPSPSASRTSYHTWRMEERRTF